MKKFKKIGKLIGWSSVVFLFCYGVYGGWQMTKTLWPGLHDDGVLYSTVVINQASGHGNTLAVYTHALLRKNGAVDFSGQGQLYYPVVSALLKNPDYESLLHLLHTSNLIAFVLAFAVYALSLRQRVEVSWLVAACFALAGSYATFAVLHYLQGRPEHAIPFVLLISRAIFLTTKLREMPTWLSGLEIGLVAAISPLPGAILGFASVLALTLRKNNARELLVGVAGMIFMSVCVWFSVTALIYDGSIWQLLVSSLEGSKYKMFKLEEIPVFWLKIVWAPGIGLIFGLGIALATWQIFKIIPKQGQIFRKALIALSAFPLAYFIWKHGISWAATNYCFLGFMPAVLLWIIDNSGSKLLEAKVSQKNLSYAILLLSFLALMIPGTGALRSIILQDSILKYGIQYQTALNEIQNFRNNLKDNEIIMIHSYINARSPVVFDSPPWKFRSQPFFGFLSTEKALGYRTKYYLVLQNSLNKPQEIPGFRLIHDRFTEQPVYQFGLKIRSMTPGYGYAVYERDSEWLERLSEDPKKSAIYR